MSKVKPGTIDFEKFFPHIEGKKVDVWLVGAAEPIRGLVPVKLELMKIIFEGNNEMPTYPIVKITFSK